jgi:glutamate racemase
MPIYYGTWDEIVKWYPFIIKHQLFVLFYVIQQVHNKKTSMCIVTCNEISKIVSNNLEQNYKWAILIK